MATGPQRYPGASTAYWYQNRYGGDLMEVNVVVLHTTEGRTLPDYSGGASAPNLTAVPDFANRKLKWYQHFDIDRSSRALVNLAGGVETNTLNVVQVELVGTCDPATHTRWGSAEHVFWPEAPEWALAELAVFLRWMNAQHGVPLVGPSKWPAYPTSYGNGGGQRMSFAQWGAFKGVCGHMHVPENAHGDPGSLDCNRLIALAKGTPTPPPEEDTMPTADEFAKAVWDHPISNRFRTDAAGNPRLIPARYYQEWSDSHFDDLMAALASVEPAALTDAQVQAIADKVAASPVLADVIAEKVAAKLAARLAQ